MKKRSFFLFIILLAGLVSPTPKAKAAAQACSPNCVFYLPAIYRSDLIPPIIVTNIGLTGTRAVDAELQGNLVVTGDIPVYDPVIEVRWYRYDGSLLAVSPGHIFFKATFPGHLNYFLSDFTTGDSYSKVQVFIKGWSFTSDQVYAPLTIVDKQVGEIDPSGNLTAKIHFRNDQSKPLKNVQAMIWTLGQGQTSFPELIAGSLDPGQTIEYLGWMQHVVTNTIYVEAQGVLEP